MKKLLLALCLYVGATLGAQAGVSCSVPYNLTNGTTADATQVMANYNAILACLLNGTAESGANSSITSLNGLTTPIAPVPGYTSRLSASLATAGLAVTVNADVVVVCATLATSCYTLTSYSQAFNGSITGAGGMDTGAVPTSGWLALYAIYNPITPAISILGYNCATACGTIYPGSNMPSGYTASALLSVWPTNATPALVVAQQYGRSLEYTATTVVNSSATSVGCTSVSLTAAVPPNAVSVGGDVQVETGSSPSAGNYQIEVYSNSGCTFGDRPLGAAFTTAGNQIFHGYFIGTPLVTPQTFYYSLSNSGTSPNAQIVVRNYSW